eukprot:753859-Hanusia_phi.AAC.3
MANIRASFEQGGYGIERSIKKAVGLYNEAAVAAEEHMKAKARSKRGSEQRRNNQNLTLLPVSQLASKYYEKAAELEAELEDDASSLAGSTTPSDITT